MAYENVRFTTTNMAGDATVSYFYTVSGGVLYKRNKTTGVVVSGFPPDYSIGEVSSLQFDGVYYWTLERQSGGFLIRKWEIVSSIIKQRSVFSYVSDVSIMYDSFSFSVDTSTNCFCVFNKYSPYDVSKGALLKFDIDTGVLISYSSGSEFSDIRASCLYDGKILFVKGNEVIFINPDHLTFNKHMAIENLDINRADIVPIYAIFAYLDVLYSLQNKRIYYSGGSWNSESWGSQYNYVSSSLLPIVYFIELVAIPDIIHAISVPDVPTATSNIELTVLDQYRVPMSGKTVNFTTSIGSVSPISGITDTNGKISVVYSGTSNEGTAEIKATVL
jgi:hypothetical protein